MPIFRRVAMRVLLVIVVGFAIAALRLYLRPRSAWFRNLDNLLDRESFSTIDYRGQTIKLSKAYIDYDEYKDDPNNLDPSEIKRVEQLVAQAPIAPMFPNRSAFIRAEFDIVFPGYGCASFGLTPELNGARLDLSSIEIPQADEDRYFVCRVSNATYTLVDDFIAGDDKRIERVRESKGQFVYSTDRGEDVLTRPIKTH